MIDTVAKPFLNTMHLINELVEVPSNKNKLDHLYDTLKRNGISYTVNRDDTIENIISNLILMSDDWIKHAIAVFAEVCIPDITIPTHPLIKQLEEAYSIKL